MGRIVIVCYIMHYCVSLGVIVQCACMLWSKLMQARGGAAGCVNIDLMAKMLTVVYLAMVVRLNKAGRFLKQWQQKC
jgi:hypothetical protein